MADGNARGFSSADKYVFLEIKCGSKTSLKALSYTKHSGSYGTGTTKISRFGSDVYIFGGGGKACGGVSITKSKFLWLEFSHESRDFVASLNCRSPRK